MPSAAAEFPLLAPQRWFLCGLAAKERCLRIGRKGKVFVDWPQREGACGLAAKERCLRIGRKEKVLDVNGISLRGGSALGGALKCVRSCVLGCGGKPSQDVHPPRCTSAGVAAQIATEYRCEGRRRGRRRKVVAWPQGSRALGGAPIGVRSCVQGCGGEPSQKGVLCW
jgi:hypothetical protein